MLEQPSPPAPRTPADDQSGAEPPADPGPDLSHRWALAATLEVDESAARLGVARRYHLIKPATRTKFRVEDAYCVDCHLALHQAVDKARRLGRRPRPPNC